MSTYAIKTFHSDLERLKHFGGTNKESAIRFAFQKLLDEYAKSKDLMLVPEISLKTRSGKTVTPDGTLKDMLRLDHGYWESKDEADDIDEEIRNKFAKHYPNDNIIFEDSSTAVLIQHGQEVMRTSLEDEEVLDKLLTKFVSFERKEITDFRKAIDKFREDIPKVTETLHDIIGKQEQENAAYKEAAHSFHQLAKQSINPEISEADIKEMMVQHILSADIFNTIFDEPHFHQENNIARELNKVIDTFFTGATRRTTLGSIQHYYQTINAAAAGIVDHHEKQKFLKVVYENFYKAYNPKAADRLGIVYTPNEIVQFMIKSTDYLLHKHFGKTLADKNVDILDPATGTGTFICDIIDFLPKNKLEHKYKHELHANELAILPYYIANLNIEYTYKQKMGSYAEFESLCLVDTLDNNGFVYAGKQGKLFNVSAENAQRIIKQNERKISVVIGNPPYNANQLNENDNNKNRDYPDIDHRIKSTYIKQSTAQKTKLYDMYARFLRWASDRLEGNGIIAFVSNNSFINSRTFDGFRKSLSLEFNEAWVINLKGNARTSGERRKKEGGNIFDNQIRVGIAIYFLIKNGKNEKCRIFYNEIRDYGKAEEKKFYITDKTLRDFDWENITPDQKNNWIELSENNWDTLIPLCSKEVKAGRSSEAVFADFTIGSNTARDEWVYDFSHGYLNQKLKYFVETYNQLVSAKGTYVNDKSIKWTRGLKQKFDKNLLLTLEDDRIVRAFYRPFVKSYLYHSSDLIEMPSLLPRLARDDNKFICFSGSSHAKPFQVLITNEVFSFDFLEKTTGLPLYRFDIAGNKVDNITDWGLAQFSTHYQNNNISKEDIFHYVYAVLHHPAYRSKYELNLKREFPRIPFYDKFEQWAQWGKQLMELHINYESVALYELGMIQNDYMLENQAAFEKMKKAKLKANKATGTIELDGFSSITGIPAKAWEYKLGNRSALEWILDQYKEKKPGDPTIAEKFNTYKFADYKEQVIDLLSRVCTVSVETMKIVEAMPGE